MVYCGAIERNYIEKENIIRIIRTEANESAYGDVSRRLIWYNYSQLLKSCECYIKEKELDTKLYYSIEARNEHVQKQESSEQEIKGEHVTHLYQEVI